MFIHELIHNSLLVTPLIAYIVAQITKTIDYAIVDKRFDWKHLTEDGGMPSAHSATVVALATAAAFEYGLGSAAFAISTVLAIIVMHDAMGVRLESGKQAHAINEIVRSIDDLIINIKNEPVDVNLEKLKEIIGHTPLQVFFGGLVGLIVGLILH